jgi:hypothetical protein
MYKEFRKTATVKAKLFEKGDENGMIAKESNLGDVLDDVKQGIKPELVPYIRTLENQFHKGEFGKHYLCYGIDGECWLVDKDIFERTYEEVL